MIPVLTASLLALALPTTAQEVRTETVDAAAATAGVILSGSVKGDDTAEYTVSGAAGQILSVDLLAENGGLNFNITPKDAAEALFIGATSGTVADVTLPAAGDYVVQVYLMRSAARRDEEARYTLGIGLAGGDFADGLAGGPDWWQVTGLQDGSALNIRSGPHSRYPVLSRAANGELAQNRGCRMTGPNRWCNVRFDGSGQQGFVVDFVGFVDMVDAVGGVTVYIPEPISDPNSKIYFETGCQTLDGKRALDYVRVRKGVGGGDGSDTGRIERQQAFLTSLIQKVTSSGVLFNPMSFYDFLDAVTRSVTTDTGIGSIRSMAAVAVRVRAIGLESIEFTTVPYEVYPPDPNRVQWAQPEADEMWAKLIADEPLTPTPSPTPSESGGSAGASPRATPSSPDESASSSPTATASPSTTFDTTTADQPVCPTP